MKNTINNADEYALKAQRYSGRLLQSGACGYEDKTFLIRDENLMKIAEKHIGVPVIINHQDVNLNNVEQLKIGVVSNVFLNDKGFTDRQGNYHEADNWAWYDMLIDNAKGIDVLDNQQWKSSNSYEAVYGNGSFEHNGVLYDNEIIDAVGLHLAIVPNPRYEEVKIIKNSSDEKKDVDNCKINSSKNYLINSKYMAKISEVLQNLGVSKIFKTISNEKDEPKQEPKKEEESKENSEAGAKEVNLEKDYVMNEAGEKVLLKDVMNTIFEGFKAKENESEQEPKKEEEPKENEDETKEEESKKEEELGNEINPDHEYQINMKGSQLLNMYKHFSNKNNSDEDVENESQDEIDEKKKENNEPEKEPKNAINNSKEEGINKAKKSAINNAIEKSIKNASNDKKAVKVMSFGSRGSELYSK